jgi:hypothetical protein
MRQDELKRLVAIEPGIKPQCLLRHAIAVTLKRVLKTAQDLQHAVDQSALDIENEA